MFKTCYHILALINVLQIGHELQALTPDRTLDSLYIQPLVSIIEGQNPNTEFNVASNFTIPKSVVLYLIWALS